MPTRNVYSANMARNANTVNIKSEGDYHHGDLRAAVIDLGLKKLAEQNVPELGLRQIARELGVSATALYRHFPNKDALMDALALAALRRLGKEQASAASAMGDQRLAFRETGYTYVRWAVDNPSLFRLVFSRVGRVDALMDGSVDLGEAFMQLAAGIAQILPDDAPPQERLAAQLHAWSLVHGLANLIVDGQIAWDEVLVRSIISGTFGLDRDAADCA